MDDSNNPLFAFLFPEPLLEAAGRVWSGCCDDCRRKLALDAFGHLPEPEVVDWPWHVLTLYSQAQMVVAMSASRGFSQWLSAEIVAGEIAAQTMAPPPTEPLTAFVLVKPQTDSTH